MYRVTVYNILGFAIGVTGAVLLPWWAAICTVAAVGVPGCLLLLRSRWFDSECERLLRTIVRNSPPPTGTASAGNVLALCISTYTALHDMHPVLSKIGIWPRDVTRALIFFNLEKRHEGK